MMLQMKEMELSTMRIIKTIMRLNMRRRMGSESAG